MSNVYTAKGVQNMELETIVYTYGNMLFRTCLMILGNEEDAKDAVQETMLKYLKKAPAFENTEHKKAWLITVATNQCRDMLRFRIRHPQVQLEYIKAQTTTLEQNEIMESLMSLPEKYRTVLILHYVEEYKVEEIANIIGKGVSAVKMRLHRARKMLEEKYGKELE